MIFEFYRNLGQNIKNRRKELGLTQQQLADKISTIDCLLAFAEVSVKYNYVRPEMSLKREVNIVEGRHPVIETFLKDEYVKNDVIIQHPIRKIAAMQLSFCSCGYLAI